MTKKFNFARELTARLKELGMTRYPDSGGQYPYRMEARVGTMMLDVWSDALVTRFVDAKRACADPVLKAHIKPYNTKWNFHFDDPGPVKVEYVITQISLILPGVPE